MPSPWIIRSVVRPVVWAEPWPKLVLVAPTWTPRPTWIGLVPPRVPGEDWEAPVSIWLSVSWKTVVLDLKPMVLALAMLLPVTSSITWLTRRPLMPAKSERSMVVPLDGWVLLDGGGGGAAGRAGGGAGGRGRGSRRTRLDGLDLVQGHLAVADVEHR